MPTQVPPRSTSSRLSKPLEAFPQKKVRRMLGITAQQLHQWERLRLVEPQWRNQERVYTFADLISLNTIKQLTRDGLSAARLRHALELFRRQNRAAAIPITELRIRRSGRSVVIDYDGTIIDPVSGQIHLRFDADTDDI